MQVRVMLVGPEPAKLPFETVSQVDALDGPMQDGRLVERLVVETFWKDLGLHAFDLALVAAEDLPSDFTSAFARLRSLPQKPEIAILGHGLEAQDHVRYLAAGAYAVIPTATDPAQIVEALD